MQVAFVLTDSPIAPCGGLGVRFAKLLPFLEKEFDCLVYCNGKGGTLGTTQCIPLNSGQVIHGCSPSMMWTDQILACYQGHAKPDIVVCADYSSIMPAKALATVTGAKFVVEFDLAYFSFMKTLNQDELTPELRNFGALMLSIERLGAESADLVIGCSEFYRKELPWPVKRSVAIPNGINYEEWTGPFKPYKFQGDFKKNLVFIGRMNSQKGIKALTDYQMRGGQLVPSEEMLRLPSDTALHFVGGPIAGDQYKAVLETVKFNRQKFHIPFISGQDKINLLRSCDGVIFPSKHEPFGIVGLEAMAAGVPLITTAVGGISDYAKPGINCLHCELTPASIEHEIQRLNALWGPYNSMEAKETAKKFSWSAAAEKFIQEVKAL